MSKNVNIQDLLDNFDSIPSVMSKLNQTGSSSTRSGQDRIAHQASRVVSQLSKIDSTSLKASSERAQRDISETAALARQKLKAFYERVGDAKTAFSGYDTLRRGKVSYSDFSDTLLVANSGLTRNEAHILAARLDSKKSGSVEYSHVLKSLQELEQLHPTLSTQSSSLSIGSGGGGGGGSYSEIHGSKLGRQQQSQSQSQKTCAMNQNQEQVEQHQPRYGRYQRLESDTRSVATTGNLPTTSTTSKGVQYEESYSLKYLNAPSSASVDGSSGGNPVVSVQYLSPTKQANPQNLPHNSARYDPIRDWMKPHRRGAGEHRGGPPPYHIDPEGHLGFGDTVRRKRSSSAPPRQPNTRPASLKDHILSASVDTTVSAASAPRAGSIHVNTSTVSLPGDAWRGPLSQSQSPSSYLRSTSSSRGRGNSVDKRSLYNTLVRRANPDSESSSVGDDVASVNSRKTINLPHQSRFFDQYHKRFMPGVSRNWNSKTMHKVFDAGFAAEEEAKDYRPAPKNYRKEVEDSVLENSIASQLGGRTNVLRHLLRQSDISGSGNVNFLEFEHALKKAGVRVPQQQLKQLFQITALDAAVPGHGGICYTAGKSLNIEDFVASVADHASKQEIISLKDETRGSEGIELERRRVLKKVLHAANRQSDPIKAFTDIDQQHLGYLKPEQIHEALKYVGAAVDDREFSYLMHNVARDQDGKVSIADFDRLIHSDVVQHERTHIDERRNAASNNPRYTATYNSTDILHQHAIPEYSKSTDNSSKSSREDRRRWSRLRGVLQEHCEQVVEAFKNGDRKYWNNNDLSQSVDYSKDSAASTTAGGSTQRSSSGGGGGGGRARKLAEFGGHLPIGLIRRELEEVGVQLGSDDAGRLDELVRRELGLRREEAEAERKERAGTPSRAPKFVSLDKFCDIIGIHTSVNPSTKELVVSDPMDLVVEAGAFSGYADHTNPTYKTTFLSDNASHSEISGTVIRHIPQKVYEHTYEPHKFWKLEQSKGIPDLMPCPLPSFRDGPIVDKTPIVRPRGVATDMLLFSHRRGRAGTAAGTGAGGGDAPPVAGPTTIDKLLSQSSNYMIHGAGGGGGGEDNQAQSIFDRSRSTLQNIMARRRSSSAPPRSQSSGSVFPFPSSPSNVPVSRFATKSLADFIETRNTASDVLSSIDYKAAASPKFPSYAAKTTRGSGGGGGAAFDQTSVGSDEAGSRASASETPRNYHFNTGFSHNNGYQGQSTLFRLNLSDNAPASTLGTFGAAATATAAATGSASPGRYTLRRTVEGARNLRDVSRDGPFAKFGQQN